MKGKQEAKGWKRNVWILKHKRFYIKPGVSLGKHRRAWSLAARGSVIRWNSDLADLGKVEPFQFWPHAAPPSDGYLIHVEAAPAAWRKNRALCGDLMHNGDQSNASPGFMARTVPYGVPRADGRIVLESASIYVCVEKFEAGVSLKLSHAAKALQPAVAGRLKILRHEFVHLFWFDHPKWAGSVGAANALTFAGFSSGEELILRRFVLPQLKPAVVRWYDR